MGRRTDKNLAKNTGVSIMSESSDAQLLEKKTPGTMSLLWRGSEGKENVTGVIVFNSWA
jgi:hypothetical protein